MIESFKAAQSLAMPSAIVFFFWLAGVLFLWMKRNRTAKIVLTIGVAIYYLFSIAPFSGLLLSPLERPYESSDFKQARNVDTAVLLTGGEKADQLRASAILQIFHQWRQAKNQKARIILSGSDPLRPDFDETGVLRDYLVERGVPSFMIFLDPKALNTRQSSVTLREILGPKPFFLVTSAYHMTRSLIEFRRLGMKPVPAAADFLEKYPHHYTLLSLLPGANNLIKCDIAFHEYGGILYYRLLHWRSRD